MKRKQLLAVLLASAMLTTTIVLPLGNVTVRAAESVSTESIPDLNDAFFEISDNGVLIEYTGNASDVVIPEGVKQINPKAFEGCTNLKKVIIPDSVTKIFHNAFRGCTNLTEVELSKNVTIIGVAAFRDTAWLDNLKKENDLVVVNHCLLDGANATGEVVIPEGVTVIAEGAFNGNNNITKVTVPEGVTVLERESFSYCENLEEIVLPATITQIVGDGGDWWGAIEGCKNLKQIEIPENVTVIEGCSFSGCSSLSEIKLPSKVTKIEYSAFANCESLTRIEIPKSVTSIGEFVFYDSGNLKDIYYAGTQEEWNQIEKKEDSIPGSVTIHYESTMPDGSAGTEEQGIIANDENGIPNAELYQLILMNADKDKDGILTVEEAAKLESLYIGYKKNISDLKGMEYCTGLKELSLNQNTVLNDIGVLSKLTNLEKLSLSQNAVLNDISVLSNLTTLKTLSLSGEAIHDVTPLENLTNLKSLTLASTSLTNINCLAKLQLEELSLQYNSELSDIGALSNLTTLKALSLYGKAIHDVTPLVTLVHLESLSLWETSVTDISCLADLVLKHNLKDFGSCWNDNLKEVGNFPTYVIYEEEVEIRYLNEDDRIRIMEMFNLSEYDGKVICTNGGGKTSRMDPFNGYGYDYSVSRDENGQLTLGRSEWMCGGDDLSFILENAMDVCTKEDGEITIAWNGAYIWVLCHGNVDASGLHFTDKVEKGTKIEPFAIINKDAAIRKAYERDFGMEAVGYLKEQDTEYMMDYFGFEYWGGGVSLIPTKGAEYRIDFDASSYRKEDLCKLSFVSCVVSRDENGKMNIDWNDDESYALANGKLVSADTGFLTKGEVGTDIEDCVFTIPAMDKEKDEVVIFFIQLYTLDDAWSGNVMLYNEEKTIEVCEFTKIKDANEIEEETKNETYEVELSEDKTEVSAIEFKTLLKENQTKDVVIKSNDDVTFIFAKGTMSAIDGMENYDFGTNLISKFEDAGIMDAAVTKENFVSKVNFSYSGKLPAEAFIKIFVGTHLSGKTLHYSHVLEDGFKHLQSVKVDAEGYIIVKQDHCSDYVITTEKIGTSDENAENNNSDSENKDETGKSPDTGDNYAAGYVVSILLLAGFVVAAMQKKGNIR